jgi:hypothetical protein
MMIANTTLDEITGTGLVVGGLGTTTTCFIIATMMNETGNEIHNRT